MDIGIVSFFVWPIFENGALIWNNRATRSWVPTANVLDGFESKLRMEEPMSYWKIGFCIRIYQVWTIPSSLPDIRTFESGVMFSAVTFEWWFFNVLMAFLVLKSHILALVSIDPLTIKAEFFLSVYNELTSIVWPLRQKETFL